MNDREEIEKFLKSKIYDFHSADRKLTFIYSIIKEYSKINKINIKKLNILDVGCADGNITFPLATLNCNITSFDLNDDLISIAKKKIAEENITNIKLFKDNCYNFKDYEKTYDIIIASEIIEHLSDPTKFIINMKKVMNNNSYFIVTIPNAYSPWDLFIRVFHYLKNKFLKITGKNYNKIYDYNIHKDPYSEERLHGHVQQYSKNEFIHIFENLGFNLKYFQKANSFLAIFDITFNTSIDEKVIDFLPYWVANGWYFVFELKK